jgi:hypothetical protein
MADALLEEIQLQQRIGHAAFQPDRSASAASCAVAVD